MVPALIILALWVALLAPGVVRWLRNHKPIDLRRLVPPTAAPAGAHRSEARRTGVPAGRRGPTRDGVGGASSTCPRPASRPAPVGPDPKGVDHHAPRRPLPGPLRGPVRRDVERRGTTRGRADEPDGVRPADTVVPHRAHASLRRLRRTTTTSTTRTTRPPMRVLTPGAGEVAAHAHHRGARRHDRRRRSSSGCCPALGILWAVTFLGVLALVGYLGLMFYASNAGLYGTRRARAPDAGRAHRHSSPTRTATTTLRRRVGVRAASPPRAEPPTRPACSGRTGAPQRVLR